MLQTIDHDYLLIGVFIGIAFMGMALTALMILIHWWNNRQ